MADPVSYERRGSAAVLTIQREERRNAVDGPTAGLLAEGYRRFVDDDAARVLVLTGAGDLAFCAGADLKAIETLGPRLELDEGPLGFTRRISPKPTIAAISGWCLAGGLELALWCDLRVATETAKLGFTERRFGVPLIDGGTQRLPRIVGLGRALDMILTGRNVRAKKALQMGLLDEMVHPSILREVAVRRARAGPARAHGVGRAPVLPRRPVQGRDRAGVRAPTSCDRTRPQSSPVVQAPCRTRAAADPDQRRTRPRAAPRP